MKTQRTITMTMISKTGLLFYSTLKLVLIALFSLSLNYAGNVLAAEEVVCNGDDLLELLADVDPDRLALLRKQADGEIYGSSRLWKISKAGVPDSWVFGTMHMADDRISVLPQSAREAFAHSKTVLVEVTDMLDPVAAKSNILKLKHLTFRLDGSTIESDLSEDQLAQLKLAVEARSLPYELVIGMQPWMLAPAIGNPLCEVAAKKLGKPILDAKIMKMALERGKNLVALETTEEQLIAISSMPWKFQIQALIETLEMGAKLDDIRETMKHLYVKGDISMIIPAIRYFTNNSQADDALTEFQDKLVVQRNIKMARRANDHFQKGSVFMAIGAMHLPGKTGLVALLEKKGFHAQAVETPLY